MRIEILLSTYCGEKYLREQLDSLLSQRYDDYHITIRDDGSKDNTVKILTEYQSRYPDRIGLLETGSNLGYPDCFWELLEKSPAADMYSFCDQDDVWDANKLAACEEKCRNIYQEKPVLYVHDYLVADESLQVYRKHRIADDLNPDNPYQLIFYVMASGFTMILNEKLRQRVLRDNPKGKNLPHDRWIFWCGFFAGEIVQDDRTLVTYRRHDASVTQTGKGRLTITKEWWERDICGKQMSEWDRMAKSFSSFYCREMSEKGEEIPKNWNLLAGNDKAVYFKRLMFPRRLKPSLGGELALRIAFLLNRR